MQMPGWPVETEATCGKTCRPVAQRLARRRGREQLKAIGRKQLEAWPRHPERQSPERSEWAIGRLRPARPRRGAPSAAFVMAARRGRKAITGTEAWDRLGPEEAPAPRDRAAEAAVGVVEVEAVGVAAAGTGRNEREP
jgi:hypothetical protein